MIFLISNPYKGYAGEPPAGTFDTLTNQLVDVESQFYAIVRKGSIYVLAVMLIVSAIGLLISATNPRERSEKKKFITEVIFVTILAFSVVGLGTMAYSIGLDWVPSNNNPR